MKNEVSSPDPGLEFLWGHKGKVPNKRIAQVIDLGVKIGREKRSDGDCCTRKKMEKSEALISKLGEKV